MGWDPERVQKATFWEFACAFAAWKRFNNVKTQGADEASIERLQELGIE